MDIRQNARKRGFGSPKLHGSESGYFFFLATFFFAGFFLAVFLLTLFFLVGAFFFALTLTLEVFFLVDFLDADFFFATFLVAFLLVDFFLVFFFKVFDFFLEDFPKAAAQPSEYFSLVPILKIVMIFPNYRTRVSINVHAEPVLEEWWSACFPVSF